MKKFGLIFFVLASAFAANQYYNHQMWRVTLPEDSAERDQFMKVLEIKNVDVWASGNNWVDIQVTPKDVLFFMAIIKEINLETEVKIKDIGSLIDQRAEEHERSRKYGSREITDMYHTLDEIYAYMTDWSNIYPDRMSTQDIGSTVNGNPLTVAGFFEPGTSLGAKPAVWVDCGIHAREWITPATCLNGMNHILTSGDQQVARILSNFDIYILPVLNPDGYDYTHTDDRMWRKNRRDNAGSTCIGVDLNRNYDDGSSWGGGGSSSNECSETYRGESGFSEAETSSVRDFVTQLQSAQGVATFYSIHSYGQLWMYVYGCCNTAAPDTDELDRVAGVGVSNLTAINGTPYEYGDHFNVIYQASGVAIDWSYTAAGITYSYLMELRDEGTYGFLLPADQILPTAQETWAGIFGAIEAM